MSLQTPGRQRHSDVKFKGVAAKEMARGWRPERERFIVAFISVQK